MNWKKITTWEKACEVRGYDPNNLPNVSGLSEKFQKWLIANYKLAVIAEAINTDENGNVWEPDFTNGNWKYFPWFEVKASEEKPGGFAFSYSYFGHWYACTSVGSRLCFDSSDKVYHVEKYFEELYLEQQLILK